MPAHRSLRQQKSQRLSITSGDILHGGLSSFRNIGLSIRNAALHEKSASVDKQNNTIATTTATKMNIFGSDICSQDFILSKIEKVQASPSVVELEVDEIVAMEDFKIIDALSTLFLQKDRIWKRIKFRDSFEKPQDFEAFLDGRKSLLQRIRMKAVTASPPSAAGDLPISFQVKLNFSRGENDRHAYADFFTKLQENQNEISRLVLSGDMTGSDPCDSKAWEALLDFLSNKRNSRHHIKFWHRVGINLFYYHDGSKKEHPHANKVYEETWKLDMLPIAIANLKKGMRCRTFNVESKKHEMAMKQRPGVRRTKSAKKASAPPDHLETCTQSSTKTKGKMTDKKLDPPARKL